MDLARKRGQVSARTRHNLAFCVWITLIFTLGCAISGYLLALSIGEVHPLWGSAQGIFVGVTIGLSNSVFHAFYLEGTKGRWIRRLPFLMVVAIRSAVILVTVMGAVRLAPVFLPPLSSSQFHWFELETVVSIVVSCLVVFGFSFVIQMNSLLGQGVLGNFIRGRYHRPNEEIMTFLYIDMVGSTGIAERIGPMGFLTLLDTVAQDLSDIVIERKGKIHRYVGDGIIVTWPNDVNNAALLAIDSFFAFKRKILSKQEYYQTSFSCYPEFRCAVHEGEVVVGEMGDLKREIVYLGDTVNTVSRILSVAGEEDAELLISTQTLHDLNLPISLKRSDLGSSQIRGRNLPIDLTKLSSS